MERIKIKDIVNVDKAVYSAAKKIYKLYPNNIKNYVFADFCDAVQSGWVALLQRKSIRPYLLQDSVEENMGLLTITAYRGLQDYIISHVGIKGNITRIQKVISTVYYMDYSIYSNEEVDDFFFLDMHRYTTADSIENKTLYNELKTFLIKRNKLRELDIINKYFINGQLMSDIGKEMNVTESRVSQIRQKTMKELKDFINDEKR